MTLSLKRLWFVRAERYESNYCEFQVYVIGKEIWVVRRRSLPNVTSISSAAIRDFAVKIGGVFVEVAGSSVGGYAVFQSTKMSLDPISSLLVS